MQSPKHPTPRVSAPSNAFDPAFLEDLHARDGEPLTAGEAALAGPWKQEPVPGHPGAVAVLRFWESLDAGDVPMAVFRHEESAGLCSAVLPLVDREPLFHLSEVPDTSPDCPLPGGYPLLAVFGEQGPVVVGWLRHYQFNGLGNRARRLRFHSPAVSRRDARLSFVCRPPRDGCSRSSFV